MITMVDTMASCQVERLTQMLPPMCLRFSESVSLSLCIYTHVGIYRNIRNSI